MSTASSLKVILFSCICLDYGEPERRRPPQCLRDFFKRQNLELHNPPWLCASPGRDTFAPAMPACASIDVNAFRAISEHVSRRPRYHTCWWKKTVLQMCAISQPSNTANPIFAKFTPPALFVFTRKASVAQKCVVGFISFYLRETSASDY